MPAPEPGALALGVLPRALVGSADRLRLAQLARQQLQGFAVADRLQQRQVGAEAPGQLLRFLHQAIGIERTGTAGDPLPEVAGVKAQFKHPPGGWPLALLAGQGPTGGVQNLQGPLGAHGVGMVDAPCRFRIGLTQQLVAGGRPQRRQLGAQGRLWRNRRWLQPLGEGLQVQPAAPHEKGHAAALVFGGDGGLGRLAELLQVQRLVGRAQVEQAVGHAHPLSGGGFGGADVHARIKLSGIHREHREAEVAGQLQGQGRLTAGGGPEQHEHEGKRSGHPGGVCAGRARGDLSLAEERPEGARRRPAGGPGAGRTEQRCDWGCIPVANAP
jgi:hypothetical protein